jgi:hypothetical protein
MGKIWVHTDERDALFVSTANEVKERKERNFAIASICAFALSGLGWALALAAQLSGVKVEGASEDG